MLYSVLNMALSDHNEATAKNLQKYHEFFIFFKKHIKRGKTTHHYLWVNVLWSSECLYSFLQQKKKQQKHYTG